MDELRAALAIARKDLQNMSRYRLWIPMMIFNPLYQAIIPAFLFGASFAVGGKQIGLEGSLGTTDLAGFLFMGGVISGMVSVSFWSIAFGLRMEMDQGVLEPSWLTPTRRETIVLGRALGGFGLYVPVQLALFAVGTAFFGLTLRPEILLAVPALVVATIALAAVGYAIAGLVLVVREANFLVDTVNFLFTMISGVAFPITVLPLFLQVPAVFLPSTWAVEILRLHAIGARTVLDPVPTYLALFATSALFVPLGLWSFRSAERWVRVHGTIAQH
jgi:ABC-2 type transport system permease protein